MTRLIAEAGSGSPAAHLWFVIRFPHQRRARKIKVAQIGGRPAATSILLACSLSGLAIIPFLYFLIVDDRRISGASPTTDSAPGKAGLGLVLMRGAL